MPIQEETLKQTKDTLVRLYLSAGLRVPPEELVDLARERIV